MADPIDIAEARRLLTPVVGCHAERIRIGEPTNRDRLMVWVLNNLGPALDEIEKLRGECHGRRFDPNLVDENARLRGELAEAHEALTAARAEVEQLRETTTYYRNTLGINVDSPTDVHVRPGPHGVSVERVSHHKGCSAHVTSECECLPIRTSDLLTRKEDSNG